MIYRHKNLIIFSIIFLLGSILTNSSAQCPSLVWADEFDDSVLKVENWSHQLGDGCDISNDLCGWGNNELQWYRSENTTIEDGKLKITAKRESFNNKSYTSSRINSKSRGDWTYGRFEASIKLPTGKGLWPAFWMLPTDNRYGEWPQSGEIDIMELIGSEPDKAYGTIHFGDPWPNNRSLNNSYTLNEGVFNNQFHQFAIEWEENEIRWYIDDYLYSTLKRQDLSPTRWPFDQRFHFLLNVSVGGTFPGNPDGTTSFPQTMEVDYVRVYDGYFPHISGARSVANQKKETIYQIQNAPNNSTFEWEVPADATIVSGQGTKTIKVDWNNESGAVKAKVSTDCYTKEMEIAVFVAPPISRETVLENFDDASIITFNFSSGTLVEDATNPNPNEINESAKVGEYTRSGGDQFDVLFYDINNLAGVSDLLEGEKKFYMDIYTAAPVGTQILLQLENSPLAQPTNYPRGRHSRYETYTTKKEEWHRLEFQFVDRPDAQFFSNPINNLVLLFAPNSSTNDVYYFDNFDIYGATPIVSTKDFTKNKPLIQIYPNPSAQQLFINNLSNISINEIQLISQDGQILQKEKTDIGPKEKTSLSVDIRSSGLFFIKTIMKNGESSLQQVVLMR